MLILLPGNPTAFKTLPTATEIGFLMTGKKLFKKYRHLLHTYSWALDNQCFTMGKQFDFEKYLAVASRAAALPGRCLFVTVPDAVGNAEETHQMWKRYAPALRKLGVPLAYVAQDGLTRLPRVKCDALFVGGTTEWKLSQCAAAIMQQAKRRGLWIHMGRVNSVKRMHHAYKLGADSVDGTGLAIDPKDVRIYIPALRALHNQMAMAI